MRRSYEKLVPRGVVSTEVSALQREVRRLKLTKGRGTRRRQRASTSGNSMIMNVEEVVAAVDTSPPVWG